MNELAAYMRRALDLATRGGRSVMPNPMVGAVITHQGHVIGEGYHQAYGGPHAEVHAIRAVRDQALLRESTLFVTLEPCSHFGKTPPCADLIIESHIPRVIVGCRDPFPAVAGRGLAKLRSVGIQVSELLGEECAILNRRFILAHRERRPYIILKWAQSIDGYLAPATPNHTWFTCKQSRELLHRWRAEEMAILVGTRTVSTDNPSLTVRYGQAASDPTFATINPLRVTVDRVGVLNSEMNIFNAAANTLIFGIRPEGASPNVQSIPIDQSSPLPAQICRGLYERHILSLIVEGGSETLRSYLELGLWDEARIFQAPIEFGAGVQAPAIPAGAQFSTASGVDTITHVINPQLPGRLGLDVPAEEVLRQIGLLTHS